MEHEQQVVSTVFSKADEVHTLELVGEASGASQRISVSTNTTTNTNTSTSANTNTNTSTNTTEADTGGGHTH